MKLKYFLFTILFLSVLTYRNSWAESTDTCRQVSVLFKKPPLPYRSMPLWVWNDRVTEQEIKEQLVDFKNKGLGGVFVHPRPGLITPYLSNEWFDRFNFAVETGKKLGMLVWIYDENSYPSGFAGGHVPAEMPESIGKAIQLIKTTRPDTVSDHPFLLLLKNKDGFEKVTARSQYKEGLYYLYIIKEGYKSAWNGGYTYVDLMQKKVTDKFLEITYDHGYNRFSSEYGKTIPGTFMDEPNIMPVWGSKLLNFSDGLMQAFQERNGYSLEEYLPALSENIGNYTKIRHDYYSTLLQLFINGWAQPYRDYCRKHNLILTGHYWDHEWPRPQGVPDNMALTAYSDMPGIDLLMNHWFQGYSGQFGNSRMVRELRSVANQIGQSRTFSETYGASGWDISFADQKKIADWEFALGVNFLNQHLSYVTIAGARKRDHPQSFSYHEPWWPDYKPLADYIGRLSVAMSKGAQQNHILVIEPTTTAWMYYTPSWNTNGENKDRIGQEKIDNMINKFHGLINKLEKWQVEYDLGCEDIIKNHGSENQGSFIVGKCSYNLVILPESLENLEDKTVDLLEQYLSHGGKVLSYCGIPTYIDASKSERVELLAKKYAKQFVISSNPSAAGIFKLNQPVIRFSSLNPDTFIFHQRRVLADAQMLFFANSSDSTTATGKFSVKGGSVEQWDLFSGEVKDYPCQTKGDSLLVNLSIPVGGSLLLCIKPDKKQAVKEISLKSKALPFLDKLSINRIQPNALTIDFCDLRVKKVKTKDQYFYLAQNEVYKQHGFEKNPWDNGVQFNSRILDKDTFSLGSGFEADYKLFIENGVDLIDLQLVAERPEYFSIFINGKEVKPIEGKWWLDKAFGVYNIASLVKTGENIITLKSYPFKVLSELESVYVLGNFALEAKDPGFRLVPTKALKTGSWKDQGMPFYCNGMAYTHTIDVKSLTNKYMVKLNKWKGTVSEVYVNDQPAGLIAYAPYELDISNYLKTGKNKIEVVVKGSLRNLLGPHHVPADGSAWPSMWFYLDKGRTLAGDSYIFKDYGLMSDFEILMSK
jgi:hypothetical protein